MIETLLEHQKYTVLKKLSRDIGYGFRNKILDLKKNILLFMNYELFAISKMDWL